MHVARSLAREVLEKKSGLGVVVVPVICVSGFFVVGFLREWFFLK